ncbi:MAG: hypothetical protein V3T70_04645 [Phycisphaerae bacterium]
MECRCVRRDPTFGTVQSDVLFYYDGQRVIAEYNNLTGALVRHFVDGPLYVDEHLLVHDSGYGRE